MCVQLFSCPLCTRNSFESLDSLRIGLVSVATRPLICPVCNETLLGIDKLTIHLFGHTINVQETTKKLTNEHCVNDKRLITEPCNITDLPIVIGKNSNENSDNNLHNVPVKPLTQVLFVNELLQQPDIIEVAQSLHSTTSNEIFDNSSNSTDIKLMTVLNSSSLSTKDSTNHSQNHEINLPNKNLLIHGNTVTINNTKNSSINIKEPVVLSKNDIMLTKLDNKIQQLTRHIPEMDNSSSVLKTEKCQYIDLKNNNEIQILPQLRTLRLLTTKEKTERCNICGFHFPDNNILQLHKQLVHMIAEKDLNVRPEVLLKNYPCHLCHKIFKMRGSLMVHMRVAHTGYNLGNYQIYYY